MSRRKTAAKRSKKAEAPPAKRGKKAEPSIWLAIAGADPGELPGGELFQELAVFTQRFASASPPGEGKMTRHHGVATALMFVVYAGATMSNSAAFRHEVIKCLLEQQSSHAERALLAQGGAS